ncbi:MAG: type IV pilus modification PilV family protein [Gemmatimonadota bacterium]
MTGRGPAAGFSLMEVLVALVLVGTGLLAMGGLLSGTLRASRDSIDNTVADHLIRHKLAEMRALPVSELRDGADRVALDGVEFERRWRVTPNDPESGITRIEVGVTWSEYRAMLTQPLSQPLVQTLSDPLGTITNTLAQRGRTHARSASAFRIQP